MFGSDEDGAALACSTTLNETDCPYWVADALDVEPEQCWCLSCGEPLPCRTCHTPSLNPQQKEPHHA
jgi:hypothetical protein